MTDIKNHCIINLSKLDNYFIYQKGGNLIMNVNGIEYENTDTLKVEEAAKLMHKNPSFVRCGLRDKRFNFGCAVFHNGRWNYYINKQKFFEETGISVAEDVDK